MLYDSAEGKPIQSSKNDDDQASYNVISTFTCNMYLIVIKIYLRKTLFTMIGFIYPSIEKTNLLKLEFNLQYDQMKFIDRIFFLKL